MLFLSLLLGQAMALPGGPGSSQGLDRDLWSLALGVEDRVEGRSDQSITQELLQKIHQFVPVQIALAKDTSGLSEEESKVLELLVRSARHMDPIFNRQVYRGYRQLRGQLAGDTSDLGKAKLDYFDIMRGPWDRQDDHKPFAVDFEKPVGAGFYPSDLTEEQWTEYLEQHPEAAPRLADLLTMVEREEEGRLVARNYSLAFGEHLAPARALLEEAAGVTSNESLRRFLLSRAAAFLSNDYYQSDKDWMDLDSRVEITIGPYEVYEDRLKAQKASFEAFVTITDPVESEKLSLYKSLLPEMEQNLPIPEEMKSSRGAESPIRVVDLVFSSGEARKSVQTIAFNLPNDERVRKEKGAKKVLLRNSIEAKFKAILEPIASTLMKQKQLPLLDSVAYFNIVLFHELSHSLGPAFVGNNESRGEVRAALGAAYSGLEEAKADVMGVFNILFMIGKGQIAKEMQNKALFTYISGLFRSVRFGVSEAHGKGAALQLNRFLEEGAVQLLDTDQTYQVNFRKLETSISNLVRDICTLQHLGDKAAVEAMFEKYGQLSPSTLAALSRLEEVPVDLRPCYPGAGEDCQGAAVF